jgi:hypothetical protein
MYPRSPGHTVSVRQSLLVYTLVFAFAAFAAHAGAQNNKPTVVSEIPERNQFPTDVAIPKLSHPVRLADFEGMTPRPGIKAEMAEIDSFVQSSPTDGHSPTQKTVAYIGHTTSTLYVVFLCFDTAPRQIRAHLARRENVQNDDNVSVLLDTFQDRRRGVLFQLNPVGVQADAAWTEGNQDPDYSYDQVWDSEGQVTQKGWMALFAIPFRSLRFRPTGLAWGVVLTRNLPRNSETDNWPRISSNVTGTLPQEGTFRGIEGVTGSHNVQINPYGLMQNEKTLNRLDPLAPYFSNRKLEGTIGGDVKVILHDTIVLDGTINPDFSQVESDQPQFTVNQRYSVFFPELRPFFLENANYFTTPIDLLNTRNIIHPEFGGRVTGKVGKTNIGLLAIDDKAPGEVYAPANGNYQKHALFAVARVSQDFGKGSNLGAIYTDEEFAGSWNRIGGIDFTARLNEKWTVQGQAVESSTKALDGSYSAGPASKLEISRQGHSFNLFNTIRDYSSGFQSQVGYIQTSNFYQDSTHLNYQWYPKNSALQSIGWEANNQVAWDHSGNRIYHYTTVSPFLALAGSSTIAPLFGENSDTVGPQNGYPLDHNVNFTENFAGLVLRSAPLRQLSFNIVGTRGGNPNYSPPAGKTPFLMDQFYLQAFVTTQPFRSLTADETYLLDRNFSRIDQAFVFENQTLRTKLNYQFTRALSARVIVQYDSVLANTRETSLVRTKQVSTEALLTWLPHPGTAIYVGYNSDLQNLDRTLCNRLPSAQGCDRNSPVLPRTSNYLNDGRQIFIKASYLLRF